MTKHPCDGKGFSFIVAQCAKPVGDQENGYNCIGCVFKKYIKMG